MKVIVRWPGLVGPDTAHVEAGAAVQSTTSAQYVCAAHAVCSSFAVSLHVGSRRTLDETGSVAVSLTRPHATRALPQVAPLISRRPVRSHSPRSVVSARAAVSTPLAQRRYRPRLSTVAHGQVLEAVCSGVAMARSSESVEAPLKQASCAQPGAAIAIPRPTIQGAIRIRCRMPHCSQPVGPFTRSLG